MTALVRTELLKLVLTRATWGLLAAALALVVVQAWLIISGVGRVGSHGRGTSDLAVAVLGASGNGTLPLALLGVVAATGEFHHATLTSTLLTAPQRTRVVVAKAAAVALLGMVLAAVLLAVAAAMGLASGAVGTSVDGPMVHLVAGVLLGAAFWGWLGVGLGSVVGNQSAGVLIPVVWVVVIETLLPSYGLAWVLPWTPGGATAALAGADGAGVLPMWAGGLLLGGYGLALTVPGARRLLRRDVT